MSSTFKTEECLAGEPDSTLFWVSILSCTLKVALQVTLLYPTPQCML
jgi:hypothetical protein